MKAGRSTLLEGLIADIDRGTHVGSVPPEKKYESTHIEELQKILDRRKHVAYAPTEKKGDDLMDDLFRQPKTGEDSKKEGGMADLLSQALTMRRAVTDSMGRCLKHYSINA